jgi:hypothetical protein
MDPNVLNRNTNGKNEKRRKEVAKNGKGDSLE